MARYVSAPLLAGALFVTLAACSSSPKATASPSRAHGGGNVPKRDPEPVWLPLAVLEPEGAASESLPYGSPRPRSVRDKEAPCYAAQHARCGAYGAPRSTRHPVKVAEGAEGPEVGWVQERLNQFLRILDEERWLVTSGKPRTTDVCPLDWEEADRARDELPPQLEVTCRFDEITARALELFFLCTRETEPDGDSIDQRLLHHLPNQPPRACPSAPNQ